MTKPTLPKIDYAYLETFLVDLLNIPSPSGYTDAAISFVEEALKDFPEARAERTKKKAVCLFTFLARHLMKLARDGH